MTAGPWVRRFPTGRLLDDEAREFSSSPSEIEPAVRILRCAEQAALIDDDDARVVGVAFNVAGRETLQANKTRGWAVRTVRNVAIAMIGALAVIVTGYGTEVGTEIAKRSQIAPSIQTRTGFEPG
jgi:hypothetical protein